MFIVGGLFPCLCGAISELFSAIEPSDAGADLVGSTFNIQNFIPYKSQKTKAMAEINRPIEFQRGTVGATESAKEGVRVLAEGSDIGLGAGCRAFESHHSDQNPLKSVDFSGFFLFFVYCGAIRTSSVFHRKLCSTAAHEQLDLLFSI